MNCHYCNKEYRLISSTNSNHWFSCDYCNVTYQKDHVGNLQVIRFKTILNEEKYCLDLLLKSLTTEILHIPFNLKKRATIILHLPFLAKGITPANCQDKIKTYITFS